MTSSSSAIGARAAVQLRDAMSGSVWTPKDDGYDAARQLWNGAADIRPAVIARCANETDVMEAVVTAREHDLQLSVRGGGHDWAGRALRDSGLVIDLSDLRGVSVAADEQTAVVGGGATAGDIAAATRVHGLTPVTGTIRTVGITGLTLGGGYGPLCGRYGLALDNLRAADVVLADGRRVRASPQDDSDLYWALRGAGASVGVVTASEFRIHPLKTVLGGLIMFPVQQGEAVLRGYRELIAEAPDELTVACGFLTGPEGSQAIFLFPTWTGDLVRGKAEIDRYAALGNAFWSHIVEVPYVELLEMFDPVAPYGRHYAVRARSIESMDDHAVETLIESGRAVTSPFSAIVIYHFHGAASRVPEDATAFALRRDHHMVEIVAGWPPVAEADRHLDWANTVSNRFAEIELPGGYTNMLGPDELDRVRGAYGTNLDRVRDLTRRYDPDGVFSQAVGGLSAARMPAGLDRTGAPGA